MTTQITEHKFTTKRKEHPNDVRYPCRSSQEILSAGLKLLSSLSQKDCDLLKKNELILDEEETAELYDAIQSKDIIGLALLREKGFISNKYEVLEKTDQDYMICKNLKTEEKEEISFQDVSIGFALGFAEILYRDEKPFGISEDIEYTIKIHHDKKEEKETKK